MLAHMVEMLGVHAFRRLVLVMLVCFACGLTVAGLRMVAGASFRIRFRITSCAVIRMAVGGLDVAQVQRLRGGGAGFGLFCHHFQRIEHRIVGTFLILLGFLLFPDLLGKIRGDLRRVFFVEMLHEAFGDAGLAVVHRSFAEIDVEPVGEVFEQPYAFGVDAGGRQVDDFGDAVLAVGAGGFDVGEIHIRANVHAKRICDAVHHLTYAETAGACAQVQHADAYDHARFGRYAGFGDGFVPIPLDVFHIERNRMRVEIADGFRVVVGAHAMLMFFAHGIQV